MCMKHQKKLRTQVLTEVRNRGTVLLINLIESNFMSKITD